MAFRRIVCAAKVYPRLGESPVDKIHGHYALGISMGDAHMEAAIEGLCAKFGVSASDDAMCMPTEGYITDTGEFISVSDLDFRLAANRLEQTRAERQVVVAAACRVVMVDATDPLHGFVVVGVRHFDPIMRTTIKALGLDRESRASVMQYEQGFIDNYGTYMTREEALAVAMDAGQIRYRSMKHIPHAELLSEDLY